MAVVALAKILLLYGQHLLEPAAVTLIAGEPGFEEGGHQLDGQLPADHAGSQAEDIHIVVLHALVGRVGIVAEAGPDRTPGTLLATIQAPTPLPQITKPRPASPEATAAA